MRGRHWWLGRVSDYEAAAGDQSLATWSHTLRLPKLLGSRDDSRAVSDIDASRDSTHLLSLCYGI